MHGARGEGDVKVLILKDGPPKKILVAPPEALIAHSPLDWATPHLGLAS